MRRLIQLATLFTLFALALMVGTAFGSTWYVDSIGGPRYSTQLPTGTCDGTVDAAPVGSTPNQHCAFQEFQFLYDTGYGGSGSRGWVIAGGDTVIVKGCTAFGAQVNPDNPHCRLGWSAPTGGANIWGYGVGNNSPPPPIPAGTSGAHTRFLGANYAACNTGNNPRTYQSNLTQLYGGFGMDYLFDLRGTSYVDFECLELAAHNGTCVTVGTPAYPAACTTGSQPYSDYAADAFETDPSTANILLQDISIHGFTSQGLFGPIGGLITWTRVFDGFNAADGWQFDDGSSTADGASAALVFNHVWMQGEGCEETYPITQSFPALVCYDDLSGGPGGDTLSGQTTTLPSLSCNDCHMDLSTKDCFIGPHTFILTLSVTNSETNGCMGQNWKWGGNLQPNNTTFTNNLTMANCMRMASTMSGAPANYNQYLSDFCRASGSSIASTIPLGSTWLIANNTFVVAQPTLIDVACPVSVSPCTSTINWTNNIVLGYPNIPTVYGTSIPGIFYNEAPSNITINTSNNIEFGTRNGACPSSGTDPICEDPLLVGEPIQATTLPSALDAIVTAGFLPASGSPAVGAGVTYTGLPATDYYGTTTTSPPVVGAANAGGAPGSGIKIGGSVKLGGGVILQ